MKDSSGLPFYEQAWHTKQPLKAWKPVGPDAGVSPWGAALTCRQPKGIIPAEHNPRKRRVLSCCHVLDLNSHDPSQGNIQVFPKQASHGGWDAATYPEV